MIVHDPEHDDYSVTRDSDRREVAVDTTVTSTDGKIVFRFTESGVYVHLACDVAFLPGAEWRHLARVYGSR
jgi:hypothetical protein